MDHTFSDEALIDGVKPGNQFILALVAGVGTAVACALTWTVIAFSAGPELDVLALAVGAIMGLSIRFSGKGTSPVYGILAMILTLIGSITGNILGVIASGTYASLDIFAMAQKVNLPDLIMSILTKATPSTYLLFGGGLVLAFLIAVRR